MTAWMFVHSIFLHGSTRNGRTQDEIPCVAVKDPETAEPPPEISALSISPAGILTMPETGVRMNAEASDSRSGEEIETVTVTGSSDSAVRVSHEPSSANCMSPENSMSFFFCGQMYRGEPL